MAKDDNKDIFYQNIEGKLDELKRLPQEEEEVTVGQKVNTYFSVALGIVILVGLLFTLFNILK
ncbi:MAG: accessory secretory system protein Asp4 [Streptococcus sp.]|nr:accessory secretory system protein Asp4 [Streptococcus sp.]